VNYKTNSADCKDKVTEVLKEFNKTPDELMLNFSPIK